MTSLHTQAARSQPIHAASIASAATENRARANDAASLISGMRHRLANLEAGVTRQIEPGRRTEARTLRTRTTAIASFAQAANDEKPAAVKVPRLEAQDEIPKSAPHKPRKTAASVSENLSPGKLGVAPSPATVEARANDTANAPSETREARAERLARQRAEKKRARLAEANDPNKPLTPAVRLETQTAIDHGRTVIAVAALVMAVLNSSGLVSWAYDLSPGPIATAVVMTAETWHEAMSALGFSDVKTVLGDTMQSLRSLRF